MIRRYALPLLLAFPLIASATWLPAVAGQPGDPSVYEVQGTSSPVTRTAPTVGADGALAGVTLAFPAQGSQGAQRGLNVTICSATGTTLSGAGQIKFFSYDPSTPEWAEVPDLAVSVTSTARCQTFLGLNVVAARGRLMAVASGVTFSAGSAGLTVYMMAR
jgi:hypothetical protein